MILINFHWIQNDQYVQRSFLLFLKQWSSSLALNLTPILSVAIPEAYVQMQLSRRYLTFIPFLITNQNLLCSCGVQLTYQYLEMKMLIQQLVPVPLNEVLKHKILTRREQVCLT
nr:unnamed protein product [Callosobruchus analis]